MLVLVSHREKSWFGDPGLMDSLCFLLLSRASRISGMVVSHAVNPSVFLFLLRRDTFRVSVRRLHRQHVS